MTTPSQIFFACPHAPACSHTATITLDEFREIGAPLCPQHHVHMVAKVEGEEVTSAVGMIMTGVTRIVARAMSTYWVPRSKDEK